MPSGRVERLLARRNVRGLCRALRDRDTQIRRRAAQALGELGDPSSVDCLVRAIRSDPDEYVRRWAIDALRAIGNQAAIDALTELMFSRSRQVSSLAEQALTAISTPPAVTAITLRDILLRNDWDRLAILGSEARSAISALLRSEQYVAWPSAKRKLILSTAVRLGAVLPRAFIDELADMGLFVSGIHTVWQVVGGLSHRNLEVRLAAAAALAASGKRQAIGPLYRHFLREARPGGNREALVAFARALDALNDPRGVAHFKAQLLDADVRRAAEAGRILAEIGTPRAIESLFYFILAPPSPSASQRIPMIMTALENAGPTAVEALRPQLDHKDARARLLLTEIIARSGHPAASSLLARLGMDADPGVQRAALEALAALGTAEAAQTLVGLRDHAPTAWIVRALAGVSHPLGPQLLRTIDPHVTTVHGFLFEDDGQPLPNAQVQIVREHRFTSGSAGSSEGGGWGWQAISSRARTDTSGAFGLTVFELEAQMTTRIKVVTPSRSDGTPGETFMAAINVVGGRANHVSLRIERFLMQLLVSETAASD